MSQTNTNHNHTIVQHSDFDHMLAELATIQWPLPIIRVWPGSGRVPRGAHGIEICRHMINVQAVDGANNTILSAAVVLAEYEEMGGRPFGPRQERRRQAILAHQQEALDRIEAAVREAAPHGRIRPGSIYTGLTTSQTQRCYWDDLDDIYQAIMAADEEPRHPEACPGCGNLPGQGINPDCDDPDGCGHWRAQQALPHPANGGNGR